MSNAVKPIKMVAAALGGEGGGVFTNWVIDVAEANNWLCQTTSLAGVAQRTGATIYYLELYPRAVAGNQQPVLSLFPAQGDIDITITSEIAEAGRMIERGFVSKDKTTLISSSHRVYGISEKSDVGDGSIDATALLGLADRYAKQFIHYDMEQLASAHQSVISSVMLGALAASDTLPFDRASYELAIRESGKSVESNLSAFNASFERAGKPASVVESFDPAQSDADFVFPDAKTDQGKALFTLARAHEPCLHEILYHGITKLVDYQDIDYARQYLDHLEGIARLDNGNSDFLLSRHVARYLALWMCYEDIPRVAQLKTRVARGDSIRKEVRAEDQQILYVAEFFRPRVEEVCAMLPVGLASAISNSRIMLGLINFFMGGRKLRTDTVSIFALLTILAKMRRFRRGSLGYQHEHTLIALWLEAVHVLAAHDQEAAVELANCGRLIKGYGDTRYRTTQQMLKIIQRVQNLADSKTNTSLPSATELAQLRDAAFAGDDNVAFEEALAIQS
ncbi:MAG: indolepyruvate oxidoreductase subunit beta family protein [Gammaproteobacteria bacterium]|nr:indolepyruvate oxidoreductase subunit beta family protein [Gammaproteobacteria bacterium]